MSQDAVPSLYGGPATKRVRTRDLLLAKQRGERWAMLTSYDQYTAGLFDAAGIPALLVGDSAANNVFGHETTLPVTVDELLPLVRAVVRATQRALVIADMPFGSYEEGPTQALRTGVRFLKEGGAHAVKLEGGRRVAPQIEALTAAGIPVMAHVGFTPQSEHVLGGGRGGGPDGWGARVRERGPRGRVPRRRAHLLGRRHAEGLGQAAPAGVGQLQCPAATGRPDQPAEVHQPAAHRGAERAGQVRPALGEVQAWPGEPAAAFPCVGHRDPQPVEERLAVRRQEVPVAAGHQRRPRHE